MITSETWRGFVAPIVEAENVLGPSKACGLCGNTGLIKTHGVCTPAGFLVKAINRPCICPNGGRQNDIAGERIKPTDEQIADIEKEGMAHEE